MNLKEHRLRPQDLLLVAAFFIISMAVTVAMFSYVKFRNVQTGQRLFEQASSVVENDLVQSLEVYALFLQSGAALFQSSQEVSRSEWRDFVNTIDLQHNYPGIQGVSYNPIVRSEEALGQLVRDIRRSDWPTYEVRPPGVRDMYAPILFLEPMTKRNTPAFGFDIYSEANRRDAVDRAIRLNTPQMTDKVSLVQLGPDGGPPTQEPGFLLLLPVFESATHVPVTDDADRMPTGLIVSVFEVGPLLTSILAQTGEVNSDRLTLRLYDGQNAAPEHALYLGAALQEGEAAHEAKYVTTSQLQLFGREWNYQARSTQLFEDEVALRTHLIVLAVGTLIALLLTALALGQAMRTRDARFAANRLAASNAKIGVLMDEVNHRSKNLLSVIQVIARQTCANDRVDFADAFGHRLTALAQSQDLLVRNEWRTVSLGDLIRSQLGHFQPLIDTRIMVDGPEIGVNSGNAQTIGMAIHELATNAAKYGALLNDTGTVRIDWAIVGEQFTIAWVERGGPPVTAPSRTGFGSKVTVQIVQMSLSAEVQTLYPPEGFEWRLSCPANILAEDEAGDPDPASKGPSDD